MNDEKNLPKLQESHCIDATVQKNSSVIIFWSMLKIKNTLDSNPRDIKSFGWEAFFCVKISNPSKIRILKKFVKLKGKLNSVLSYIVNKLSRMFSPLLTYEIFAESETKT